jgi:hypothetical protein
VEIGILIENEDLGENPVWRRSATFTMKTISKSHPCWKKAKDQAGDPIDQRQLHDYMIAIKILQRIVHACCRAKVFISECNAVYLVISHPTKG